MPTPLLALLLVGCDSPSAPLTSTEVQVYSFAEYLPAAVASGFQSETGARVTVTTYESNEEMLAGLAARPGTYDVIIPSDYAVEMLIASGGIQPIDLARVPNYNNVDPSFLSPYFDPGGVGPSRGRGNHDKYSLPYLWGTTGLAWDASKVSTPLTSWNDLWRPDLRGKLVLLDDSREMLGLALVSLGHDKNTRDTARIDAARDRLIELAPGVVAFDANNGEKSLLDGTAAAGVLFSGNAALAQRANPQIQWALPDDGGGIWFDNMAIPTGAPHVDAAHAFINYILRAETGAALTADFPFSNPNEAALDWMEEHDAAHFKEYRQSAATNPSPAALAGLQLVKDVGLAPAAHYEAAWTQVKAVKRTP